MGYDLTIATEDYFSSCNAHPIWYAAHPEMGLNVIYEKTGKAALIDLHKMEKYMMNNRDELSNWPCNKTWKGDLETVLAVIKSLINASIKHPKRRWHANGASHSDGE